MIYLLIQHVCFDFFYYMVYEIFGTPDILNISFKLLFISVHGIKKSYYFI